MTIHEKKTLFVFGCLSLEAAVQRGAQAESQPVRPAKRLQRQEQVMWR